MPGSIDQMTTYILLEQDDWFEAEIRFVRRLLRPGMRTIDVGANHGVYTLAMARTVGPQGQVWAFEPTPATADFLQQSLELGGFRQVRLLRSAVSDRSGTARFNAGAHSELNAIAAGDGAPGGIEVDVATLDGLAAELGWRDIDFIKIDAEGHERSVFLGGKSFFARQSPLVMFEIATGDAKDLSVARQFEELGYRIYYLVPGLLLLAPADLSAPLDAYQINLFACKDDRAGQLALAGLLATDATPPADASGDPATRALESFAGAQDAALPSEQRLGLLTLAMHSASHALSDSGCLPHVITYARIAGDYGQRASAAQAFKLAQAMTPDHWSETLERPFLAPSPRFEAIPMADAARPWLECSVVEERLRLVNYSSYFTGTLTLPLIDALGGNPFKAPEMERRRQLIRMRQGAQSGPEAHPLLAKASEQNLNPAFWRGLS